MGDDTIVPFRKPGEFEDALTQLLRTGARKLIAQALEAELADLLGEHADRQRCRQLAR